MIATQGGSGGQKLLFSTIIVRDFSVAPVDTK